MKRNLDFIDYLSAKFNHQVNLEMDSKTRDLAYYLPSKNTIFLSEKLVQNYSFEEVLYVIAHEYKHSLLFLEKNREIESFWFLSKYFPYVGIFFINLGLLNIFGEKNPVLYLFLFFFALPLVILANNPFWYNKRVLQEERECNLFANEIVGTGSLLFERQVSNSMGEEKFLKIQNILTLGLYSPTHPSPEESLAESKKYKPNEELINRFKD